jgi:hypothetical protein
VRGGENGFKRAYSEKQAAMRTDATLWHTQRRFDAEEWEHRGERLIQTHEVTVVNALAYAEALRLRLVQTMGQHV